MSDCKCPQNNPKSHHIPSRLLHGNQTRNFLSKLIQMDAQGSAQKKEKTTATQHIKWGNSYELYYDVTLSSKEINDIIQDETGKFRAQIPKRKLTFGKGKKPLKKRRKRREQGLTIVATCCCSFVRRRAENARCGRRASFAQSMKKEAMAAHNPKSQPGNPSVNGFKNASFLRLIWLCMFGRETLTRV